MVTSDDNAARLRTTRRKRLMQFINKVENEGGTQAEAADRLGIGSNFISQLKMKAGGRGIGERLARRMERSARLPHLWFDELVIEQQITEREQQLLERFRRAPEPIRAATETILEGHRSESENHVDTVVLPEKKAG